MKTKETHERIAEIAAAMASITEFAEGSMSSSSNSYRLKDGTRRKAKPHWKFQSLGARGERKYKNIPAALRVCHWSFAAGAGNDIMPHPPDKSPAARITNREERNG